MHHSAPPVYRFTPGIVEHGETMTIGRKSFIVPDEAALPQGKRTMTVGRKTYSWTTAKDVTPAKGGRVTDTLSEKDDGSSPMPAALANGDMGYAEIYAGEWQAVRTTDMGDKPLPRIRHDKVEPAPRKISATRERSAQVPDLVEGVISKDSVEDVTRAEAQRVGIDYGTILALPEDRRKRAILALRDSAAQRQQHDEYVSA
jgi:hypothetical protein